ncbi:NU3M oxidoreductase, partial [Acromyrmex insinuator]
ISLQNSNSPTYDIIILFLILFIILKSLFNKFINRFFLEHQIIKIIHHFLINKDIKERKKNLLITIILEIYFSILQLIEYINFPLTIADSIYGSSPFEYRFNPLSNVRLPFRTQFFIIRLIFLIFDIEIALLLSLIYNIYLNNITLLCIFFLLISIFIIIKICSIKSSSLRKIN